MKKRIFTNKKIYLIFVISIFYIFSCNNAIVWEQELKIVNITNELSEKYNSNYRIGLDRPVIYKNYIITTKSDFNINNENNNVYRTLRVFKKQDGSPLWEFKEGTNFINIYENIVYLSSYDTLHAININTGAVLWSFKSSNETSRTEKFGKAMVKDSFLYISSEYYLYKLDTETGTLLNETYISGKTSNIAMSENILCYDTDIGLKALDVITEKSLWTINNYFSLWTINNFSQPTKKAPMDCISNIVLHNNFVLVYGRNKENKFGCFGVNITSGEILWFSNFMGLPYSVRFMPFIDIYNNTVYGHYLKDGGKYIYALDIETGLLKWDNEIKRIKRTEVKFFSINQFMTILRPYPVKIINNILVGSYQEHEFLFLYDTATGKLIRKQKLNHPLSAPFAYEKGIIYYHSGDNLYAEKISL